MQLKTNEHDEQIFKVRLFLTIDIVGFTARKNRESSGAVSLEQPNWVVTLNSFYKICFMELQEALAAKSEIVPQSASTATGSQPQSIRPLEERLSLWKVIGDEICFHLEVFSGQDCHNAVMGLISGVESALKKLNQIRQARPTLLKSAMWMATFPLDNHEISVPNPEALSRSLTPHQIKQRRDPLQRELPRKIEATKDFVGPAIDCGFRLASVSKAGRITLCTGIVSVLGEQHLGAAPSRYNDVYYEGRVELKGVLSGTPYPVFWLPIGEMSIIEEQESALKIVDVGKAFRMCAYFVTDSGQNWLTMPYWKDCKHFGRADPRFEEYGKILEEKRNEDQRREIIVEGKELRPSAKTQKGRTKTPHRVVPVQGEDGRLYFRIQYDDADNRDGPLTERATDVPDPLADDSAPPSDI